MRLLLVFRLTKFVQLASVFFAITFYSPFSLAGYWSTYLGPNGFSRESDALQHNCGDYMNHYPESPRRCSITKPSSQEWVSRAQRWINGGTPCDNEPNTAWDQPTEECLPDLDGDGIPDESPPDPDDCVIEGMSSGHSSIWSQSAGCSTGPSLPPFGECMGGDAFCSAPPEMIPPANEPDWQCGTMNGQEVCIQSSGTGTGTGVGTSDKPSGSSTEDKGTKTTVETKTTSTGTQTITTTTTTTQTTTTTPNTSGSSKETVPGESIDLGSGPAAPHVCSDGRYAANQISCDTAVQCPSHQYVAYGVCINLPTTTVVTETTETETTTETTDAATGETTTETSTDTSTTAGGEDDDVNSASGGDSCAAPPVCDGDPIQCQILKQQWLQRCPAFDPEELESGIPEGEEGMTFDQSLSDFSDRIQAAAVIDGVDTFLSIPSGGSCPVWSVSASVFVVTIDQFCSPSIPWALIRGLVIACASFAAIRIAFT